MKKSTVLLATFLVLLCLPATALADWSWPGSPGNDDIRFGYCADCVDGGPGVLVCRGERPIPHAMDSGTLTILGLGGNDRIRPVSNDEHATCVFGDISRLTFTRIVIRGGDGDDDIVGTDLGDILFGDNLGSGSGNDRIAGGKGIDEIRGGGGNDFLDGGDDGDNIFGGDGNDYLLGFHGNDQLYGEGGNDILCGGLGVDDISGGTGTDAERCRTVDPPDPVYDPDAWAEDCTDGGVRSSVESITARDPWKQWAFMAEGGGGFIVYPLTTSNTSLLLSDRAGGASLLMGSEGDQPIAGDFAPGDGFADDVGVFRPVGRWWYFDGAHDGSTDRDHGWGLAGDRPVAGDFDRDGRADDVALFRPSNGKWYFDMDHDGDTDAYGRQWGVAGDVPVAGDFDRDGRRDDLAVFRPSNRTWYLDLDHDGDTDASWGPWGNPGDIPVAGDFDGDGRMDDVAVFRPSNVRWYFDHNRNGTTDRSVGPWGVAGDVPVAGDFDRDGRTDDVGVYRASENRWYYDHDHDGDTDAAVGPWGRGGSPLYTVHKQYYNTCGPFSLAMVARHLGLDDGGTRLCLPRDLSAAETPVSCASWSSASSLVDVGYHGSPEHIMYRGFRVEVQSDADWWPGQPGTGFMTSAGVLNPSDTASNGWTGPYFQIRYDMGNVDYDPGTRITTGAVQSWLYHAPGFGWDTHEDNHGLPWVANTLLPDGHAMPLTMATGPGKPFASLTHLKDVIKGFVDHGIPLVVGVDRGGHFNTLVGYWARSDGFFVYTADPLDGYGRGYSNQPMRWRAINLSAAALKTRTIDSLMLFAHRGGCSGSDPWAKRLDNRYGSSILCD